MSRDTAGKGSVELSEANSTAGLGSADDVMLVKAGLDADGMPATKLSGGSAGDVPDSINGAGSY